MECSRCGKEIVEEQIYTYAGKPMCEDCFINVSRFPLGHTGPLKKLFNIKDRKFYRVRLCPVDLACTYIMFYCDYNHFNILQIQTPQAGQSLSDIPDG